MEPHPIRMVVGDDLERSRLTVFFRLLLAIPHIIWLILWGIAVFFVAILSWFIVLFTTRLPEGLHAFSAAYVRYGTHVYGYLLLAASPFPGFTGTEGSYPVDVEIDPPAPQSRWKTAFRILLAIPALPHRRARQRLGGGRRRRQHDDQQRRRTRRTTTGAGRSGSRSRSRSSRGSPAWCGRGCPTASGTRSPTRCATRAQTYGYLLFLTDRYPHGDPRQNPVPAPPPPRPVALSADEDLAAEPAHRLLQAAPGDPALRLARPLVDSRGLRAHLRLARRDRPRTLSGSVPPLRRRIPAVHDPRVRVRDASSPTRSRASRERPARTRSTCTSTRPSAQSRWTILFRSPARLSRDCRRGGAGRRTLDRCVPQLVRVAGDRPHA